MRTLIEIKFVHNFTSGVQLVTDMSTTCRCSSLPFALHEQQDFSLEVGNYRTTVCGDVLKLGRSGGMLPWENVDL